MIFQNMRVVHVAAAVVAHGGADVFRNFVDLCEQLFDGKFREIGVTFERLVEVGDVSAVMLIVMDFHRLRVDIRLECVERVRERGQYRSFEERLLVQCET